MTVATGAAVFEIDLALRLAFFVVSLYGGDDPTLRRKHHTCGLEFSASNGCTQYPCPVNSIQSGDCCSVREKCGKFQPSLGV